MENARRGDGMVDESVGGYVMTTKSKHRILILAMLLLAFGVAAVWSYTGDRPTVETRTTMYVVPWPWELEWQDGGFAMRLEVWR